MKEIRAFLKRNKIILVVAMALILGSIVAGVILSAQARVEKDEEFRLERENSTRYGILIDEAKDGIVEMECNLEENSRKCQDKSVLGEYTQGDEKFGLNFEGVEGTVNDGQKFELKIRANATKSDSGIEDQKIRLYFENDRGEIIYRYTLVVRVSLTESDIEQLKNIEKREAEEEAARKAAEEAERKAREAAQAAQKRISDLKSCSVATGNWTDDEATQYMTEYINCANKEREAEVKSWEKTAPSSTGTLSLCRKQLEATYPYGTKIHSILGVIADQPESADTRFYKVQVDVTNAFGAKRSTVMECRVANAGGNMIKITHFYVY